MGTMVWAAATAHTGAMMRAPAGDTDDLERAQRVFAGFRTLGASLKAARPDVLIVIATDHFLSFDYSVLPIFAVGAGERFDGWGEFGVPKRDYRGHAEFGAAVHGGMVEAGFDLVSARDMKLDHSFSCPLQLLLDGWDVPILPLYVNCTVAPLPTLRRCLDFGAALGDVLRRQHVAERIAIVGTGGLSHWVGMPQTGTINREFDQRFLDLFTAGRCEEIAGWDSDEVIDSAGNGAAEIRNWIMAAAAARSTGANVLAYEPVAAWNTGIGVTELRL
jgi:aromatic ring-opening dioxygenase catalytic subunit (LigB family)